MVLNNSATLRQLHDDAGWRPGDDTAAIDARFAAHLRDRAADETAAPIVRTRAMEDILTIAGRRGTTIPARF